MAITTSLLVNTVAGNQRKLMYRATPDAADTSFTTALNNIGDMQIAYQSATTGAVKFAMNEDNDGTASPGEVGMSGAASGDEFLITLYGH